MMRQKRTTTNYRALRWHNIPLFECAHCGYNVLNDVFSMLRHLKDKHDILDYIVSSQLADLFVKQESE
jgi:hypothetical protein